MRSCVSRSISRKPQHEPPDGIGRSAAVVEHVVPASRTRGRDVLPKRAQQIVEQRERQVELRSRVGKRREDRVTGRLVAGAPDHSSSSARRSSGVRARARRQCRRRRAQRRRWPRRAAAAAPAQPRGDGKVLVVVAGDLAGTPRRRRSTTRFRRHRRDDWRRAPSRTSRSDKPIEIDEDDGLDGASPRASVARSARRHTVRARCSAAPGAAPPARMKCRSGGSRLPIDRSSPRAARRCPR